MAIPAPGLYGIAASNRKNTQLWSKNCFNSSFPMSLCCWLRNKKIPVLLIKASGGGAVAVEELSVDNLFNLSATEMPYFNFEKPYPPYAPLCTGGMSDKSDVVVHALEGTSLGAPRRPLEVKLTVVPDSSTYRRDPSKWAPEIVFRAATLGSAVLGIFTSLQDKRVRLREIIGPVHNAFKLWSSEVEAAQRLPTALQALQGVIDEFHTVQQPLVVQPIWRTDLTHLLDKNAFDVFVWSDMAFLQLVIDLAKRGPTGNQQNSVKRQQRAALQMLRSLHVLASTGDVNLDTIRNEMPLGKQSDKAFSVSGKTTRQYLNHPRLQTPAIPREAIGELFAGNGVDMLKPERRLDATLKFTWNAMFPKPPGTAD